jgi:DNA-binding XRE family transcriptional regulator
MEEFTQKLAQKIDNPPCVNPAHLFLGTQAENMRDMIRKGRNVTGEKHGNAKLTDLEIIEIRRLYALSTYTQQELGDKFSVCNQSINLIVNYKRRKT